MSSVTCQVSHIICHMSGVTCHLSCVMCHVSCVMCHVSCVMCHMLYIYFFTKWLSWLVSVINRAYPVWFLDFFLIKNALIPNIYLSRLVVVRFGSLKKANWWEFNFRDIGIGLECQTWQICARAHAALCAHFQKLDVGINHFFSNLDLCVFTWVTWSLFHG